MNLKSIKILLKTNLKLYNFENINKNNTCHFLMNQIFKAYFEEKKKFPLNISCAVVAMDKSHT